jgi:hypothetical protein
MDVWLLEAQGWCERVLGQSVKTDFMEALQRRAPPQRPQSALARSPAAS